MLLALKIWCVIILGFLAIGLIVGSATGGGPATSRRHAEGNSKWKVLFHPVHLFHHRRKAA